MRNEDFRGSSWGRDGRNLNANLPAGYREPNPTQAEVEAVLSGVRFDCGECGNPCIDGATVEFDGRVFCCEACQDNYQWKFDLHRRAQGMIDAAYASSRGVVAEIDRKLYKTRGLLQVAVIFAVGGWIVAALLAWGAR